MSEFRAFFRHCPACGRRFEIRLVRTELEGEETRQTEIKTADVPLAPTPLLLEQRTEPVMIEDKEFDYTYKCMHCGHQWSEVHDVEERVKDPKGYTGD